MKLQLMIFCLLKYLEYIIISILGSHLTNSIIKSNLSYCTAMRKSNIYVNQKTKQDNPNDISVILIIVIEIMLDYSRV